MCVYERQRKTEKQRICVHAIMFVSTSEDNWWGLIFSFLCMGPRIHTQVLSLGINRLYLLSPIYGPILFFLFIKTRTPDFRVFLSVLVRHTKYIAHSIQYVVDGRCYYWDHQNIFWSTCSYQDSFSALQSLIIHWISL